MSMFIDVLYFHYLVLYESRNKQRKFIHVKTLNTGSVFINRLLFEKEKQRRNVPLVMTSVGATNSAIILQYFRRYLTKSI